MAMRSPGRRSRLSRKSQWAKLGSITKFPPPNCKKKLECPMKVTPSCPRPARTGALVVPVRGVSAECFTMRPSCRALRRINKFSIYRTLDAKPPCRDSGSTANANLRLLG